LVSEGLGRESSCSSATKWAACSKRSASKTAPSLHAGKLEEALRHFQESVILTPDFHMAHYHMGVICAHTRACVPAGYLHRSRASALRNPQDLQCPPCCLRRLPPEGHSTFVGRRVGAGLGWGGFGENNSFRQCSFTSNSVQHTTYAKSAQRGRAVDCFLQRSRVISLPSPAFSRDQRSLLAIAENPLCSRCRWFWRRP